MKHVFALTMTHVLALAMSVGLCAAALAERHRAEKPVKLSSPIMHKTLPGFEGGAAGTPVAVYDFTAGNYLFYFALEGGYQPHLEDQFLKDVALGNPYGAWLSLITFGVTQIEAGPSTLDVLSVWYDTIDLDGTPVGEPVNQDRTMGVWWHGVTLGPNPDFPGAAAWSLTSDVSTLPGGGVPVSDQYFMYEQGQWVTGTNPPLSQFHYGCQQSWSSTGTIGSSGDYFFCDTLFGSDMDGTYVSTEEYYFGGPPYAANFFMAYSACLPCDTNCDGTINPFDIGGFLSAVAGNVGCSPCAGDADVNGTVNPFDIQAFITCLGAA